MPSERSISEAHYFRTPPGPATDDDLPAVIARHNLAVLTSFMQIAGIAEIEACISGHEGNVTVGPVRYVPASGQPLTDRPPQITVSGLQQLVHGQSGRWARLPMSSLSFVEALQHTLDEVLDASYSGWSEDFGGEAEITVRTNEADIRLQRADLQWTSEAWKQTPLLAPLSDEEIRNEPREAAHRRLAQEGHRHNLACLTEAMQDAGIHTISVFLESRDPGERVHLGNMAMVAAADGPDPEVNLDAITVRGMFDVVLGERRDLDDMTFRRALQQIARRVVDCHFPRWSQDIDAEARIVFSAGEGALLEVNEDVRQTVQFRAADRPVRLPDNGSGPALDDAPGPG